MAGIFADMGDSRSARPQFKKMLRKCRQKKIDLILVRSVSRFARCMAECLNVVRELRELGVEVIFEKEDIHTLAPNSDMLLSLTAVFAGALFASEWPVTSLPHRFVWFTCCSVLYAGPLDLSTVFFEGFAATPIRSLGRPFGGLPTFWGQLPASSAGRRTWFRSILLQ